MLPGEKVKYRLVVLTVLLNGKGVVVQVGHELVEVSMIQHFWIWHARAALHHNENLNLKPSRPSSDHSTCLTCALRPSSASKAPASDPTAASIFITQPLFLRPLYSPCRAFSSTHPW